MDDHPRVLVVDDETGILEVIGALLEDEGYVVRTVSDGRAALEVLRDWLPDLILLDLMMPLMDGRTFVTEYRRQTGKDIPLIVLSARRDLEGEGNNLGAVATIRKPFELDELVEVVGKTVSAIRNGALDKSG